MRFARHYTQADAEQLFDKGFKLPDGFMFGVSNAAFQVEGGYNGPGEPLNNWVRLERSGKVERSGEADHFWTDYAEEVDLAKSIGCRGFRMSVEWARVQPGSFPRKGYVPPFDEAALDSYAEIIAAIMQAGMEPMVTLHHFTHPCWLGIDAWLEPQTVALWRDYVEKAVTQINKALVEKHSARPVKYYITINEPNAYTLTTYALRYLPHGKGGPGPAVKAICSMIDAHCRAYDAVHSIYKANGWDRPMVTYNTINISVYELDKMITDLLNARHNGVPRGGLESYLANGRDAWDAEIARCPDVEPAPAINRRLEEFATNMVSKYVTLDRLAPAVDAIYSSPEPEKLDYLAVDFYDPFPRNLIRWPDMQDIREGRFGVNSEHWEWVLNPRAMYHFLKAETINADGIPLCIAENGMSHRVHDGNVSERRDCATRDVFLQSFIYEAMRAMKDGVPLFGYFYWSMVDNYEWGSYEPRFGLFAMDRSRKPARRMAIDVWGTNAGGAYSSIIGALESGDPGRIVETMTTDL